MQNQYYHYISRFLLRNFAISNYERIFVNNDNLFKKKRYRQNFKNKNKGAVLLQTYDRNKSQFGVSLVAKTYGIENMYKNFKHKDIIRVEEKLAELERQIAKNFDSRTWPSMKQFMQKYKLKSIQEVWLQNIHKLLITEYKDIKNSFRIFMPDREDYIDRMMDHFLIIWQASENDEFIITKNGFGTFEGINEPLPQFNFKYAFHYFYVISLKLVLVLCSVFLREELGHPFRDQTIFENVPHPPVLKCVKLNNEDYHSTDENVTLIEGLGQ
ncbi:unnamed protein product [Rhizophagus irregularis]|nr:unnamed protein product [Rhizophagus irregularis]